MRALVTTVCAIAILAGGEVDGQVVSDSPERFTVMSDGHPMAVWVRRPAAPQAVLLLVHGRTWSSRPDFDLQVPGIERSVMRSLAARGVAAYAVDLRGYGQTPRDATGWNTPRRSVQDLVDVIAWIRRQHPALPAPSLVGWSRGAAVAMLAAQTHPSAMSSLVMFGFAFDPALKFGDSLDGDLPPARAPNTADGAASDFISPRATPPAVVKAFVEQALGADPVLVDLRGDGEFSGLHPSRVTVPTLVIFGGRDPGYFSRDTNRFVAALATRTKRLVVLPGADHAAQLENTHGQWVDAVASFAKTEK